MGISIVPAVKKMMIFKGEVSSDARVIQKYNEAVKAEAYRLVIEEGQILIEAGSKQGFLHAQHTLEQLLLQSDGKLPCALIEDEPEFFWRSFHIDCARHFFQVEELKKMIHMAAIFKFNHFHWHFSDDQGWRIESKAYPLLHQIAAYRDGDHFGSYHSEVREGAYYTREQVTEIVEYCESQGIEVVPEIDMPGHATAILAAYPHLSCMDNAVKVGMRQGIYQNILCPGKEIVYEFIETLMEDILELFPGKFVHIGGDEVPKGQWELCLNCRKKMEELQLESLQQLQGYMQNRISDYLKKHGRQAIAWNEAANGHNLDGDIILQFWMDKKNILEEHVKKGGNMIVSNAWNCYCDYPYAMLPLKKVYEMDVFANLPETLASKAVLGTECLLWTEYIRDNETLESLAWPRFAASAEVGWCGNRRPGYEDFAERLQSIFAIFSRYDIVAVQPEGWIPSKEDAKRQMEAFRKNFSEEGLAAFRKIQGTI